MSNFDDYYAYNSTSGSSGGGNLGCFPLILITLVGAFPIVGVPILLIYLFIGSFGKKY